MKADKDLIGISEDSSTTVVKPKKNTGNTIFLSLLPFLSVLTIIISSFIIKIDLIECLKLTFMVLLLTSALVLYIRMQINILEVKLSKAIILCLYLLPMLVILLQGNPEIYSFWIIGGLLIAMLIDNKLGLLVYFNHTILLSTVLSLKTEAIIHFLIMGILISLLSNSLRNKSTVIYSSIILLSSYITLAFLMNNFIFEEGANTNYLASLFSILAVLVTAFLLSVIYERVVKTDKPSNKDMIYQTDSERLSQEGTVNIAEYDNRQQDNNSSLLDRNMRASYDLLLSKDNDLIVKIKEYSEELYQHSIHIGDLSGRAAKLIGANEDLARAGGYYHEVGKVIGKNYIEEGLKLADDYSFPEELKLILKQHSIKHDKPTSIESAIVMISDNVASTIEYIMKSGQGKYAADKIIDNIFRMRMDKGTFDDSGLSVKDFKLLKEFYQDEYRTGKVKL